MIGVNLTNMRLCTHKMIEKDKMKIIVSILTFVVTALAFEIAFGQSPTLPYADVGEPNVESSSTNLAVDIFDTRWVSETGSYKDFFLNEEDEAQSWEISSNVKRAYSDKYYDPVEALTKTVDIEYQSVTLTYKGKQSGRMEVWYTPDDIAWTYQWYLEFQRLADIYKQEGRYHDIDYNVGLWQTIRNDVFADYMLDNNGNLVRVWLANQLWVFRFNVGDECCYYFGFFRHEKYFVSFSFSESNGNELETFSAVVRSQTMNNVYQWFSWLPFLRD